VKEEKSDVLVNTLLSSAVDTEHVGDSDGVSDLLIPHNFEEVTVVGVETSSLEILNGEFSEAVVCDKVETGEHKRAGRLRDGRRSAGRNEKEGKDGRKGGRQGETKGGDKTHGRGPVRSIPGSTQG
jgi:hypothetical protein